MTISLRKTHRIVWMILALLLPVLVVMAYLFIPS
jgi:hypothetical protein